jgi:hypothetical protein
MSIIRRFALDQQVIASGSTDAVTATMEIHGKCEQVEVKVNNTTSAATPTVAITSKNGGTLFSKAAITINKTNIYKSFNDAADFDAFLADELCTFTVTPSADPGVSGMNVDIAIYLRHVP